MRRETSDHEVIPDTRGVLEVPISINSLVALVRGRRVPDFFKLAAIKNYQASLLSTMKVLLVLSSSVAFAGMSAAVEVGNLRVKSRRGRNLPQGQIDCDIEEYCPEGFRDPRFICFQAQTFVVGEFDWTCYCEADNNGPGSSCQEAFDRLNRGNGNKLCPLKDHELSYVANRAQWYDCAPEE